MGFFFGFGIVNLLAGLAALATGQPYAIWYPFVLCGFPLSVVGGALYPVLYLRRGGRLEERPIEPDALLRFDTPAVRERVAGVVDEARSALAGSG